MAPKQAEELENTPMVSSSEEEEEESGSIDEESDPSGEEDDQEKPIQKNVVVPLAIKPRPEISRENSDSFGEEDDQEKPIQTDVVVPLANKPTREGSISVPESSTDDEVKKKKMKRSRTDKHVKKLHTEEEVKKKISGDDDDEAKKQMKRKRTKSTEEEISGDDDESKKKMKRTRTAAKEEEATNIYEDVTKQLTPFQRLFSEEDELALLQGILDFTSTRGEPSKDTDGFCDFVKKLICFNASKRQILSKVQKLKQKFGDTVKKSLENGKGGEEQIVFSKDNQQKSFELSRKIWGNAGVLVSKPRKKDESEKPETNVAITPPSFGREIASVFNAENVTSFGLDESTVLARWNKVVDGPKKRAMEENLKQIKEMQVELSLKRIKFVADTANMIFKEVNASSSGYGRQNREVCSIAVEEKNDVCVEQLECNERNMEGNSQLSLTNRKHKHTDPKDQCQIYVVSRDANTEKKKEASVTSATIENEDSFVTIGGIKKRSRSNPLVSRKKLLVLDINGILANIVSPLADYKADINIGRKEVFKRPFCEDFLKFCFDKFEVGIWCPRKQKHVEKIVEFLLGDMKSKLLFCLGKSNCTTTRVKSLENKNKSVVFKDLNKLWEKYDPKLPWQKGDYNETNTVLLDESPYKALLNPPYTAIFPHSYDHKKTDTSLGNGGDLRLYLEKLVEAENVKDFIKKNPFGQEAITEASESWELYSRAIRKHTSI